MPRPVDIWLAAGVRTPFAKVDGPLAAYDAIELSVPVARHMVDQLKGGKPDFAVWGVVVPSLTFSNIAREVLMDAGIDATIPAFSTVMACSTSMVAAIEAAGMIDGHTYNLALVGGVDSLSRVQVGLGQRLSDWLLKFQQRARWARSSTTSRTSSSRTSSSISRRSPTARPASAWASIPRSPPRNGRSAARSRTRSPCRATSKR
jgi:acetyl-CoA acetyltransferase